MDLSGFFALGAGDFLGLGVASEGFLAAGDHTEEKPEHYIAHTKNTPK